MTRLAAVALSVILAAPGCAPALARQRQEPAAGRRSGQVDPMVMADYIRQIPIGSRVKITVNDGRVIRAILMKNDADPIVIQRRTRIPEPPVELAVTEILFMERDVPGSNAGRNIAIAAAAAAGATLGVLAVLAAVLGD